MRLIDRGEDAKLTKFEIDNFVTPCRNHSEVTECLNKIIAYRQYDEKYELEKFLNQQSRMDTRLYKVLVYSQYLAFSPEKITLKIEKMEELKTKIILFNKLLESGNLVQFKKDNKDVYRELLYSELDLISYHQFKNLL